MQKEKDNFDSYFSIVENNPDLLVRYDRNLRHVFLNRKGLIFFNTQEEKIINKTHRESGLFESYQCDYWEDKIKEVFKTGIAVQELVKWQRSEDFIWLDWRLAPEYDDKGNVIFVLGIARDATNIVLDKKTIFEREEIFSHFLEHSPIYVFFKDSEIRSLRLSKNYEEMLGRPLSELIGKTMDDLFPSELAKKMIADDKRILNNGKLEIIDEELNGRYYTTLKFPIIIDGVPKYLAGYTIDKTDEILAYKALNEKAVELERFNNLMLGRELKMIELKKEINELLVNSGKPKKYKLK